MSATCDGRLRNERPGFQLLGTAVDIGGGGRYNKSFFDKVKDVFGGG
jgi:hypothetical protein